MADEPTTPQKVTPTVNWASLSQTVFLALITALQGANSYQLSAIPRGGDPTTVPPAPPAPVITAVTLHEDNARLEKLLTELSDKLDSLKPKK